MKEMCELCAKDLQKCKHMQHICKDSLALVHIRLSTCGLQMQEQTKEKKNTEEKKNDIEKKQALLLHFLTCEPCSCSME